MDFQLAGKTALVCGASKGLGLACASALAREGVHVVITARTEESLLAAAASIRLSADVQVVPVAGDITTQIGRDDALSAAVHLGRKRAEFDIVVTNAGGPPAGNFRDWDTTAWQAALLANMLAPIELMKATIDGMADRRWGRIINITSSAVKAPIPHLGLSNGARSGLTGFVAGLARQVAHHGITINNLLPGTFNTDRFQENLHFASRHTGTSLDQYVRQRQEAIPAKRFGEPHEFGAACAYLCSQQAAYITGQNLLIDGGAYTGTF